MRVPLSWLRDYVDVDLEPAALAERLTVLGMEVKGLERWGADWRSVVVGELREVASHPRADRLSLTRVVVGDGEPLEIVCGATNIAVGQRVPVALPGAVLPGGRAIGRTEKMGVVSNGMLCSGEELGLTTDGDGILILPPDTPIGAAVTELYGDWVLDVDVKPNRGDALSLVGLAREVAAVTGGEVRFPQTDVVEDGDPIEARLAVDVADPELCPRFVGRWISDVTVGPAPDRIQMRLLAAGLRPVSNVVDASNYVMLELGKPIHTFDGGAIAVTDGRARLVVRRARAGERLETLDHVERDLDPSALLIADRTGPLALAGVMGGAASEVSDTTTAVVVESAIFDPVSIRRTAFRYALRSEASLRFEKGQEHRLARLGADRAARLVREWAGGSVAAGTVDTDPREPEARRVAFRPARVNRLLGIDVGPAEQSRRLGLVGIATEPAPGATIAVARGIARLDVTSGEDAAAAIVPSWRRDLEIEADVAEEIARLGGYETIPPVTPDTAMPGYRASPLEVRDVVRAALAGAGLHEVLTYALVAPHDLERLPLAPDGPLPVGEAAAAGRPIHLTNPLSSQHSVLRQRLLPSLLGVVDANCRRGAVDVAIFEAGKGYGQTDSGPTEWWRLGIAWTGAARPRHWSEPVRPADLDDVKGIVELLARRLGFGDPTYEPLTDDPALHPGRAASVLAEAFPEAGPGDDQAVGLSGRMGELHPAIAALLDLGIERVVVAEFALAGLSGGQLRPVRASAPSRHPAVERDLAAVVPDATPAGAVATAIRAAGGILLTGLDLFDVYHGAPLASDEKSLAWRLVFAADRTLTDAEVDAAMSAIGDAVVALGGRVRD